MWLLSQPIFLFWFLSSPAVFFTHNRQRHQQVRPPSSIQVEYRTASSEGHYRSRFVCSSTKTSGCPYALLQKTKPGGKFASFGKSQNHFSTLPASSFSEWSSHRQLNLLHFRCDALSRALTMFSFSFIPKVANTFALPCSTCKVFKCVFGKTSEQPTNKDKKNQVNPLQRVNSLLG